MKKNVWILNHYASSAFFNTAGRHYWFAKYLKKGGYDPVVFGCNMKGDAKGQYIETDSEWIVHTDEATGVPLVLVNSHPFKGNGLGRIRNMLGFYRHVQRAAKQYAKTHTRPDIILASSVHPLTLLAGIRLAKRYGVRCICEVRDLWPESIVAFNSRWSRDDFVIRLLYRGEKYLYKKADALVFTFEGGYDYIRDKGWDKAIPREKVYYINNGVDLEDYERYRKEYRLEDGDLDDPDSFKIIYTGSLRKANNIGAILDIAGCVKNERIRFLIWGGGNELEALRKRAEDERIANVRIKGRVDTVYIPGVVSRADLNYLHFQANDMDYRYGISPYKLFDYMAAGRPVLCDVPSRYNPMVQEDAGFEISGKTPQEFAEAIDRIAALPREELDGKARNAEKAAQKYDFRELTRKLTDVIERT